MNKIYKDDKFAYYNRKEVIKDGSLIDISDVAKQIGIKWPVAITQQAYHIIENRLEDIIFSLSNAMKETTTEIDIISFKLIVPKDDYSDIAGLIKLQALITSDEYLNPLITIMLADEDL